MTIRRREGALDVPFLRGGRKTQRTPSLVVKLYVYRGTYGGGDLMGRSGRESS